MMLRRLMCGVGKKQIHDMSLNNESSAALQRTDRKLLKCASDPDAIGSKGGHEAKRTRRI